jgi:uncharacterized membrane protein (UPF0127 family)
MKFLLLLSFILPLVACLPKGNDDFVRTPLVIERLDGSTEKFEVELALKPQEFAQGLMNRESMADNHGMLFYFGNSAERRFWMKNTLIPLDILFIKENGEIHHIHKNAQPHDLSGVPSMGNATAALEINGGLTTKLNIQTGDKIRHAVFSNFNAE